MPVTRSEAMFFTAGLVIGAAAGSNFPVLKEKFGPLLSGASRRGAAFGESYSEMAKKVAEKVEAVQDAMAEMKQAAAELPGMRPGPRRLDSSPLASTPPHVGLIHIVRCRFRRPRRDGSSSLRLNSRRDQDESRRRRDQPRGLRQPRVEPALPMGEYVETGSTPEWPVTRQVESQGQSWTSQSASPVRARSVFKAITCSPSRATRRAASSCTGCSRLPRSPTSRSIPTRAPATPHADLRFCPDSAFAPRGRPDGSRRSSIPAGAPGQGRRTASPAWCTSRRRSCERSRGRCRGPPRDTGSRPGRRGTTA